METIVAAAGIIIVAIASIFAALFQSRRRGKAEGELENEKYKTEQTEAVLDDVNLAQQARDAVMRDNRKPGSLRSDPYNRDED